MARLARRKKIKSIYAKYSRTIRGLEPGQIKVSAGLTTSDLVNTAFNSALWEFLEQNEKDAMRWSDDFVADTCLSLWRAKQRELFRHEDPSRLEIDRMAVAIEKSIMRASQMALGDDPFPTPLEKFVYPRAPFSRQQSSPSSPEAAPKSASASSSQSAVIVSVVIDCRELSFAEANCLALVLDDCESYYSEEENLVSASFEVITDSTIGIESWLTPRLKLKMLKLLHRAYPEFQVPLKAKWRAAVSRLIG